MILPFYSYSIGYTLQCTKKIDKYILVLYQKNHEMHTILLNFFTEGRMRLFAFTSRKLSNTKKF